MLTNSIVCKAYHHRVGPIVEFQWLSEEIGVVIQSSMASILGFIRVQFDLVSGAERVKEPILDTGDIKLQ